MKSDQTCQNCAAYYALEHQCRRKAPTPFPVQEQQSALGGGGRVGLRMLGVWPPTQPQFWCAEWLPDVSILQ